MSFVVSYSEYGIELPVFFLFLYCEMKVLEKSHSCTERSEVWRARKHCNLSVSLLGTGWNLFCPHGSMEGASGGGQKSGP